MALRTIRVQGDPVLEKICKPVKELTPRTKELIEDMLDTMYEANGVGLAALVLLGSLSQAAQNPDHISRGEAGIHIVLFPEKKRDVL